MQNRRSYQLPPILNVYCFLTGFFSGVNEASGEGGATLTMEERWSTACLVILGRRISPRFYFHGWDHAGDDVWLKIGEAQLLSLYFSFASRTRLEWLLSVTSITLTNALYQSELLELDFIKTLHGYYTIVLSFSDDWILYSWSHGKPTAHGHEYVSLMAYKLGSNPFLNNRFHSGSTKNLFYSLYIRFW